MKFYNIFYSRLGKYQSLKTISRYIVHYLKKFDIEIPDHLRGQFQAIIYSLRNTEWNIPLNRVSDFEVDERDNFYFFSVKVLFSYKGVELSTDDLPWFLKQNRYKINNGCIEPWYYRNFEYFFKNAEDKRRFEEFASKYNFLMVGN